MQGFTPNSETNETSILAKNTNYNFKLKCNESYKIIAKKDKYIDNATEIKTSKANNQKLTKNILLEPIIEFITVRKKKMIKTNPIYFDLNSSYLNPTAKVELNKVVEIMKKYPNIVIKCGSHTDSRASEKYNVWLSNRRAKSTMDYIISKGISSNRISSEGFGETQLVNKCANNSKCSEAEHQMNRRTEFVIIDE